MSLKNSILLFKGNHFKDCGPKRTFFCPDMEKVNDLITYTYNYSDIETTNTTLKVGNLDSRYNHFISEVMKILGKKLNWISVQDQKGSTLEILYNPLNKSTPRVKNKQNPEFTNWDNLTLDVYKNMDSSNQFNILDKFIERFQDTKYCKFLKATPLEQMDNKLYNKIMSSYYHAKITPCIPITMYIIDPKIVRLYPPQERIKFLKKFYNELENPEEYLDDDLNINDLPLVIRNRLQQTTRRKRRDTPYDVLLKNAAQHSLLNKKWDELTIQDMRLANPEIKNKLLEKFINHFKDEKYCALLQSSYVVIDEKLFAQIIEKYVKERLRPCVPLEHFDVEPRVFKLYPEKDRLEYFNANYKLLSNPHDYLKFINISKIDNDALKFIANRKPSDFLKISWDNMTLSKFKQELNPYTQIEYLSKFGPNYYTTKKWQELYKAVDSRVHNESEYKRLKFTSDVPMNKNIEICLKTKSINDLIDIAIKKFGGNKNSYLKMTHAGLCDLIDKNSLVIQTKKPLVNRFNNVSDYHYTKSLDAQLNYVDSLDPKIKSALQKYTHQFDWQVNQVLMMDKDKPIVESLKHPNADNNTFDVNELEYGYEHVLNKNIKDVQRRLDAAFANSPPLTHSLIVYRGVKYNRGEKYSHNPIYNKQYISTSTEQGVADNFVRGSCCTLIITLSVGTHVLPLERVTQYPGEYEVLLPRGGTLQVYKQEGKKVYAIFRQSNTLEQKPVRVFDESVGAINIKITAPKYIHSIIAGTMGPGIFNTKEYVYNIKGQGMPYIVKKLPYIIMLKKITKEYKNVHVLYSVITTDKRAHIFEIKGGNVFEDGKLVKFTGGVGGGKIVGKGSSP